MRTVVVVFLVGAGVVTAWVGASRAPRSLTRPVAIGVLRAIRVAHQVAWPVAAIGVIVLGWRVARGRRWGVRRPKLARALLACSSVLIGLLTVEVAASVVRARAHRITVAPAVAPKAKARQGASGVINVVVLGESSARGVPYWFALSIGQIVQWQLQSVFPQHLIRLQILAEDGATLERALRKLDTLTRPPDAVILYAGHNEVCGRFPLARTVPHYTDETIWLDHFSDWVRRVSPLDRLIQEGLDAQGKDSDPRRSERRLIDVPACTPTELARIRDDFRARLEGLLAYCRRSGSLPILIIPPGNDGGFEPNRSVLDSAVSRAERATVAREFLTIRADEDAEPARCLAAYRALLARHPEFAEAHFRLARLLEGSGAFKEANQHYIRARDLDGLPIRCVTDYEDAYRAAASRGDCVLIDGPAVLRRVTTHGILEGQILHDAQHPTLRGYIALATDILTQLRRREAFGWPRGTPVPSIDPAACATVFGMGEKQWVGVCYYTRGMWSGARNYRYEDAERRAMELRYVEFTRKLMAGVPPAKLGFLDPLPTSTTASPAR